MTEPFDTQDASAPDVSHEQVPAAPGEHSTGGAKLFVIFFLAIVPLLGMALLAMVIYSLLTR